MGRITTGAHKLKGQVGRGKPSGSSQRWLERQRSDLYVRLARRQGYRSRAAYKLLQIDERFGLLHPGRRVLELGASPGSWSQIIAERVGTKPPSLVVAVDRQLMQPVAGVDFLLADVGQTETISLLQQALTGKVDLLLSDLAPAASGQAMVDHERNIELAAMAYRCAEVLLVAGGALVCKVFQGASLRTLTDKWRARFVYLDQVKPAACRKQCSELYLVARGFRPELSSGGGHISTGKTWN